nr:hypothetical protein [Gammaproteobacteria bacterium]
MRLHYLGVLFLAFSLLACDTAEEPGPASSSGETSPPASSPASNGDDAPMDSRWRGHLDSWPTGEVSARAPLIVRFTHPVVAEEALEQAAESVARLAPEVGFKAVFTARDRLEIRPEAPLERGRELTLTLFPQELSGVDDGLPPLTLPLTVLRQQLSLRVDALAPVDEAPARMRLDGELTTVDQADPLAVQSAVTATQADRRLEIEWHHGAAGLSHGFQIDGIHRDGEPAPVVLRWDGEPLGVEESGERQYPVPAEGAFEVIAARTFGHPQPHIRVQFSQPLMGSQDTAGLVRVNGQEARVRIDGSRLLVYPGGEAGEDGAVSLTVGAGLRSASRARLDSEFTQDLVLRVAKPGVRFVGDGVILPAGDTLSVPFEAVGTRAVKVQAFEVFADNIAGYLQNNDLNADYADTRHGRYLWQKTLSLPPDGSGDWRRYRLDLSELMARHPNGLVRLTLRIDADTIDYQCQGQGPSRTAELPENFEGPGQDQGGDR